MSDEGKDKTLSKKKRGRISKHREQIRKLHNADYTQKEIQNETGASQSAVSKELKKYREENPEKYYKVFSSEEESKALQKIEPMPARSKPVSARKIRAPARNRVYQQTEKRKLSPIKLKLKGHYQTAIRNALDNSYQWTKYNLQEIRKYLETVELNLNPVPVKIIEDKDPYAPTSYPTISKRKRLYSILRKGWSHGLNSEGKPATISTINIEWKQPKLSMWIERRLYLWEISHARRGLQNLYLTNEEWYDKMELDFPQELELEANRLILNRNDLERSGILEDIEYHIKRELKISDEIEDVCHSTEKPNITDLWHWNNLLRENPNHPYSVLLKEKIKDYENNGI